MSLVLHSNAPPLPSEVPASHLAFSPPGTLLGNFNGLAQLLQKMEADKSVEKYQLGNPMKIACKSPLFGCHADDFIWAYNPVENNHEGWSTGWDTIKPPLLVGPVPNPSHAGIFHVGKNQQSNMIVQDEDEEGDYDDLAESSQNGNIDAASVPYNLWTTLMIRNIPDEYNQEKLAAEWPNTGNYDFLFVPTTSYAFVNFTSEAAALSFMKKFQNTRLLQNDPLKRPLHIRFSLDQGLENNLRRWRKKRTWRLADRARPLVFRDGIQVSVEEVMKCLGLRPACGLGLNNRKRTRVADGARVDTAVVAAQRVDTILAGASLR
jgi:hypothetical protein